ncbi:MAG: hypothetical protein JSU75_09015 [Gammaproteobacteria bacterium]|nr:MAG: hypothetical protein JSU75_09015 [Gammaproteobacteria bacterium]
MLGRIKQNIFILTNLCLVTPFVAILCGCVRTATGPVYEKIDHIPEGSAIVYIYRSPKFTGHWVSFDLFASDPDGDKKIVELKGGGYFPYYTRPGKLHLFANTEMTSSLTMLLNAGDQRFVKVTMIPGAMVAKPMLTEVAAEIGESEIKECRLLHPTGYE